MSINIHPTFISFCHNSRSLDIQGTPRYNSITAENGRTLTAGEQTTLLTQLAKLRPQCNPICQAALDDFIGNTKKQQP